VPNVATDQWQATSEGILKQFQNYCNFVCPPKNILTFVWLSFTEPLSLNGAVHSIIDGIKVQMVIVRKVTQMSLM
jgi:hypothetical protein